MDRETATRFCSQWLPAWSGNQPEQLADFYADHAFYRDPARPDGLTGKQKILDYFKKLLAKNPSWKWEQEEVIPTEKGFILKWKATFPSPQASITTTGLDIVELDGRKIIRNEVFFDRTPLISA